MGRHRRPLTLLLIGFAVQLALGLFFLNVGNYLEGLVALAWPIAAAIIGVVAGRSGNAVEVGTGFAGVVGGTGLSALLMYRVLAVVVVESPTVDSILAGLLFSGLPFLLFALPTYGVVIWRRRRRQAS